MMDNRKKKRQKVYISYAIAIVLPCIVLGILAYRGIKNDQALLERELRISSLELGQRTNEGLVQYLNSIESEFLELSAQVPPPDHHLFADSVLSSFVKRNQVIQGIFYHSPKHEVSFMNTGFMYLPDAVLAPEPDAASVHGNFLLENGWDLEYVQRDYLKSVEYYTRALKQTKDARVQAELYNAIARVNRKLGRPEAALDAYQTLSDSYPDVYINGHIPLGMVALMESTALFLELGDTLQSLERLDILLKDIGDARWNISFPTYSNLIMRVEQTLAGLEEYRITGSGDYPQPTEQLEAVREMGRRTTYLLGSSEWIGQILSGQVQAPEVSDNRLAIDSDKGSYLLFFSTAGRSEGWGLIYDQEFLLHHVLSPALMTRDGSFTYEWEIENQDGIALLNSEQEIGDIIPVRIQLSNSLPSWNLVIYPVRGGFLGSVMQSNKGIFLFIFLLIVCILVFGLFFTLNIVNNEMRLSKMKSNFISTVSHEFKSPLTSIRQISELLKDGRVSTTERKQKYYAALLHESERLSHLIENILDFSRIEEGKKNFHIEKGNLGIVTEEVIKSISRHDMSRGIKIELARREQVPDSYFDRSAIIQVIQNLIDNACKYSGSSDRVEVSVTRTLSGICITIKDFGIGIQKDEHDKIFSRFYRAGDELTQRIKGSGIGLTIVKQIVDGHHGKVSVNSEPGRGSVFRVELPLHIT